MKFHNEFYDQIKATALSTSCYFIVSTFKYGQFLAGYIIEKWNKALNNCYKPSRSNEIIPENLFLTLN